MKANEGEEDIAKGKVLSQEEFFREMDKELGIESYL